MAIGRIPEPGTGIPESIVDAKGDIVTATAADTPARLAVGTNEHRLVAASGEATGLKYVADTTNYAVAAKGDLLVGTAADTVAVLSVGTDGHTLVADSSVSPTGLKWAAPGGASGLTLVSSTSLSASTININSVFSATYENYVLILNVTNMSAGANIRFRLRASSTDTTTNYGMQLVQTYQSTLNGQESSVTTYWQFGNADPTECWMVVELARPNVAATTFAISHSITGLSGTYDDLLSEWYGAVQKSSTQFDGITIFSHNSATITGTMRIYGRANS